MLVQNNVHNPSFSGITKIYAMTDSHQEARRTCELFSKILQDNKHKNNLLFLNCGDIFKGIYPRKLERDTFIKMKKAKPDMEMITTLGNNDFGFSKENLDFLIKSVKKFTKKGIQTVCANVFTDSNKRPDWLKPYTIVEKDGDKTFVTGFCINNINTAKFGLYAKNNTEVLDEICNAIKKENPKNVVVLNHDYMNESEKIVNYCKSKGINIDLVIGGHEHNFVKPNKDLHIFYPEAYAASMYKTNIINDDDNRKFLSKTTIVKNDDHNISKLFLKSLKKFEKKTALYSKLVPSTLNLTMNYSAPSSIGTFLADTMKKETNSDIAFFSTGFISDSLKYSSHSYITKYMFEKALPSSEAPIKTVELNSKQLFEVFKHAFRSFGYGNSNPKFLQCSNNLKFEGHNNPEKQIWELEQIYINNKPLLDKNLNPIDSNEKFTCAIDNYIAQGGQGYSILNNAPKTNKEITMSKAFLEGLKKASKEYKKGSEYKTFEIKEK